MKFTGMLFISSFFFDAFMQLIDNGYVEIDLSLLIIAVLTSFGGSLLQIFESKKNNKLKKFDIPYIITSGAFLAYLIYEVGEKTGLNHYVAVASALGGYMSLDILQGIKKVFGFLPDLTKLFLMKKFDLKDNDQDNENDEI